MWIKLTIILGVIAICCYLYAKLMAELLEPDEKIAMALGKYAPRKVVIPLFLGIVSAYAAVICLIIAIVTW